MFKFDHLSGEMRWIDRSICFFTSAPKAQPVEPLPTREDPSIAESKRKERLAAAQRRGRTALISGSREGDTSNPLIVRPSASDGKTTLG